MPTLLSLEYPNGRTYHTEVPEELEPGAVFEIYGRRWCAIHQIPSRRDFRYAMRPLAHLLCRQAS